MTHESKAQMDDQSIHHSINHINEETKKMKDEHTAHQTDTAQEKITEADETIDEQHSTPVKEGDSGAARTVQQTDAIREENLETNEKSDANPEAPAKEDKADTAHTAQQIDLIIDQYKNKDSAGNDDAGNGSDVSQGYRPPSQPYYETKEVRSDSFKSQNLQNVVDEIKVIEDGIKNMIASRTNKVIEEKIPVEKERPVKYNLIEKALVVIGAKEQETETYTDYEIVKKEVPRTPDEVMITEFRGMIDKYINSLKGLNEGLRNTVVEVDSIVKNLTTVNDTFTDQIHSDRRAYNGQVTHSQELEKQLNELIPIHDAMSPIDDRFAEVEKIRDHLEMALRESQGMELKYKTNIDMGVKYQTALKSYRSLINDFKERGDLHVNMVDKFAAGAEHMKVAVENVSQICSGVARVTQSMVMIVESIEDGNKVLGRYASLVGDRMSASPQWEMEYNALKDAETVYRENDLLRLEQIQENRKEIEQILNKS